MFDVLVVFSASAGAQDQEIAAVRFLAQPTECFIDILATSEHGDSRRRRSLLIGFLPGTHVLVRRGQQFYRREQCSNQQESERKIPHSPCQNLNLSPFRSTVHVRSAETEPQQLR